MKFKKKMKQATTTAPKEGKKKSIGKNMAGLFNVTPKKTEPDRKPNTVGQIKAGNAARDRRLRNVLI